MELPYNMFNSPRVNPPLIQSPTAGTSTANNQKRLEMSKKDRREELKRRTSEEFAKFRERQRELMEEYGENGSDNNSESYDSDAYDPDLEVICVFEKEFNQKTAEKEKSLEKGSAKKAAEQIKKAQIKLTPLNSNIVRNINPKDLRSSYDKGVRSEDRKRRIDTVISSTGTSSASSKKRDLRLTLEEKRAEAAMNAKRTLTFDEDDESEAPTTRSRRNPFGFPTGRTAGRMPARVAVPKFRMDSFIRQVDEVTDVDSPPLWESWALYVMHASKRNYAHGWEHELNKKHPDKNPQVRFMDPEGLKKVAKDLARAQSKRKTALRFFKAHKDDLVRPNYYDERPTISKTRCNKCANTHHFESFPECPVNKAKAGIQNRPTFWSVFPCGMCESCDHTTVVCDLLHTLCAHCEERGHFTEECHVLTEDQKDDRRAQWKRLFHIGLLTRLCKGVWTHPWGLFPKLPRRAPIVRDEENYKTCTELEFPDREMIIGLGGDPELQSQSSTSTRN